MRNYRFGIIFRAVEIKLFTDQFLLDIFGYTIYSSNETIMIFQLT